MADVSQEDVSHALEVLGLTLPVTAETLARTRRALLYTWNPARYSNLTNNPKKYMESYKKGVRGFDEFSHLFGLLVGLHVFLGVVGQI